MKRFITFFLCLSLILACLSGCEGCDNTEYANAEEDAVYTQQDVVKEVAYSYLHQGTQINYSQTLSRRNVNVSPEDATSQHMVYLDCSSYVNAVYYEAFGVNIIPNEAVNGQTLPSSSPQTGRFKTYVEENPNNPDVIGIWYCDDYETANEKQAILNQLKGYLQVGDVINYRRKGGTGHAIMYVGDGQILHSIGDDFSDVTEFSDPWNVFDGQDKKEINGSVQLMTVNEAFESPSSERYLMSSRIENVSIIRPLARNLTTTEKTKNRMLIRGLDIEKTSNKGRNTGLSVGEEITYTLTIKNYRDKGYKNVEIIDVLDDNLSFVSATGNFSANGQTVSGKITIKPDETISVSWTCKVNSNAIVGSVIESKNTTVGGVKVTNIKNNISKYTTEQLTLVANKAKEYATSNMRFDNPIDMVEQLYKEALNVELFNYSSVYEALTDAIDLDSCSVRKENPIGKMVASDLYGGFKLQKLYQTNNDSIRLITKQNLSIGDVIIAEKDNTINNDTMQAVYVYVGGNELVAIDTNMTSFNKNKVVLLTMSENRMESANVLVTIYAFNRYAVLRPSINA